MRSSLAARSSASVTTPIKRPDGGDGSLRGDEGGGDGGVSDGGGDSQVQVGALSFKIDPPTIDLLAGDPTRKTIARLHHPPRGRHDDERHADAGAANGRDVRADRDADDGHRRHVHVGGRRREERARTSPRRGRGARDGITGSLSLSRSCSRASFEPPHADGVQISDPQTYDVKAWGAGGGGPNGGAGGYADGTIAVPASANFFVVVGSPGGNDGNPMTAGFPFGGVGGLGNRQRPVVAAAFLGIYLVNYFGNNSPVLVAGGGGGGSASGQGGGGGGSAESGMGADGGGAATTAQLGAAGWGGGSGGAGRRSRAETERAARLPAEEVEGEVDSTVAEVAVLLAVVAAAPAALRPVAKPTARTERPRAIRRILAVWARVAPAHRARCS